MNFWFQEVCSSLVISVSSLEAELHQEIGETIFFLEILVRTVYSSNGLTLFNDDAMTRRHNYN